MITIGLSADGLARSRFAVSPLHEAVSLLICAATRPADLPPGVRARLREAVAHGGLDLLGPLAGVAHGSGGYIPDFLTPVPEGYEDSVEAELHRVARTPVARIQAEVAVIHDGHRSGITGRRTSRTLLAAIECGESEFAGRLAQQLHTLWLSVLSSEWARLRAALEEDIVARGQICARSGMATMIGCLDSHLSWDTEGLVWETPFRARVPAAGVVFTPSAFQQRAVISADPCGLPERRTPVVLYPMTRSRPRAQGELIGASRAALLDTLTAASGPLSTGQLARRLNLSVSTVSYHLQILHRAGLVSRTRQGRQVRYQPTR